MNARFAWGFAFSLIFPALAQAEISNCDGTWTNKGCGELPSKGVVKEVQSSADPEKIKLRSRKETIFHDLNMKSIAARRDLGIIMDIDSIRELCEAEATPVQECDQAAAEFDSRLSSEIEQVQKSREREKANRLREEANRIAEERNEIEYQRNLLEAARDRERRVIIVKPRPRRPDINIIRPNEVNIVQPGADAPRPRNPDASDRKETTTKLTSRVSKPLSLGGAKGDEGGEKDGKKN